MTLKNNKRRRSTTNCAHESQVTTEIAGMSRSVCESCGRVSVAYVNPHFGPEHVQALAGRSRSKS